MILGGFSTEHIVKDRSTSWRMGQGQIVRRDELMGI